MKWISWGIKIPIFIFAYFIKRSKASLKYLFEVTLKNELDEFYESGYHQGYRHIDHSIKIYRKFKNSISTIIDIGGANGTTSMIYAREFPQARIFTFEPLEQNESHLNAAAKKYPNIVPVMKGVGNFTGKSTMHVAERITSSSLFDLDADSNSEVFRDILKEVKTQEVSITRLDDFFTEPNEVGIIKIDVQGFELEVLKGGIKVLAKTYLVLLELNNHNGYKGSPKYYEIDEFLRLNGFELFSLFPSTFDHSRLVEWDGIYVRKELIDKITE